MSPPAILPDDGAAARPLRVLVWVGLAGAWGTWGMPAEAAAQVTVEAASAFYYTDDVSLFSAARRLALREDPTQPVIERKGQGDDMVYEPSLELRRVSQSSWGKTELSLEAQGFLFARHSAFNHGSGRLGVAQSVASGTTIRLFYFLVPDLFLGRNTDRRGGSRPLAAERLTTQFGSVHLEQQVGQTVNLRLLGRYGVRNYNEAFAQRDTTFWTLGPHLEWRITPRVDLLLGYHYERGLAAGRNRPQLNDDISYINHYVSMEVVARVLERTSVGLGLHYERNDFTSELAEDERRGSHENVYQVEVDLRQRITEGFVLTAGFQRSERKASFEPTAFIDVNLYVGGEYRF
ncbi:hypothetical protein [Nitrospira sp. Kam-Ns4a]